MFNCFNGNHLKAEGHKEKISFSATTIKNCRWSLQIKFSERKSDDENEHGLFIVTDYR